MKKSLLGIGVTGMIAVIGVTLVCAACGIGLFVFLLTSFKSHEAYQRGMEVVRGDPAVKELFGSPIQEGPFPGGNIKESGDTGSANISNSISGPLASGEVRINGFKGEDGAWRIQDIRVWVDNRQVLIFYGDKPEKGFQQAP